MPAPASTKAITNPSGTSCKAKCHGRCKNGMPPPADTPTAMPSGMLCATIAITNNQMRGAMTGSPGRLTKTSGPAPETLRSTRNRQNAPSRIPTLISPLADQGDKPRLCAAAMPGTISEKAVAASITPAPKPNKVSLTATGIFRITSTGTAPSAVPNAHNAPPCSARSSLGSRSSQTSPLATNRAVPANSKSVPKA